jgi:hypothetical protein
MSVEELNLQQVHPLVCQLVQILYTQYSVGIKQHPICRNETEDRKTYLLGEKHEVFLQQEDIDIDSISKLSY